MQQRDDLPLEAKLFGFGQHGHANCKTSVMMQACRHICAQPVHVCGCDVWCDRI